MMSKLMEDKRFLLMSLVALVSLGLSGYWLRSAYTLSDSVNTSNRSVESRIAEMVGQEGGAEEDVRAAEEQLAALVRSFGATRTELVFATLDQYVDPPKLAIDYVQSTWATALHGLQLKANKQGVGLPAQTGFDTGNFGNVSDAELLKAQFADVLRKMAVAEHALNLAIDAQVESVTEVKHDPFVPLKPNEPTPLVSQVGVRITVLGTMESFMKLLASLQQPGQFLMFELCSIRKPTAKDPAAADAGEFLLLELRVAALQIAEPVQ